MTNGPSTTVQAPAYAVENDTSAQGKEFQHAESEMRRDRPGQRLAKSLQISNSLTFPGLSRNFQGMLETAFWQKKCFTQVYL